MNDVLGISGQQDTGSIIKDRGTRGAFTRPGKAEMTEAFDEAYKMLFQGQVQDTAQQMYIARLRNTGKLPGDFQGDLTPEFLAKNPIPQDILKAAGMPSNPEAEKIAKLEQAFGKEAVEQALNGIKVIDKRSSTTIQNSKILVKEAEIAKTQQEIEKISNSINRLSHTPALVEPLIKKQANLQAVHRIQQEELSELKGEQMGKLKTAQRDNDFPVPSDHQMDPDFGELESPTADALTEDDASKRPLSNFDEDSQAMDEGDDLVVDEDGDFDGDSDEEESGLKEDLKSDLKSFVDAHEDEYSVDDIMNDLRALMDTNEDEEGTSELEEALNAENMEDEADESDEEAEEEEDSGEEPKGSHEKAKGFSKKPQSLEVEEEDDFPDLEDDEMDETPSHTAQRLDAWSTKSVSKEKPSRESSLEDKTRHPGISRKETRDMKSMDKDKVRQTDPFDPPAKTTGVNKGNPPVHDPFDPPADTKTMNKARPSERSSFDTGTVSGSMGPWRSFEAKLKKAEDKKLTSWVVYGVDGKERIPLFSAKAGDAYPNLSAKPKETNDPSYYDLFCSSKYAKLLTDTCKNSWVKAAQESRGRIFKQAQEMLNDYNEGEGAVPTPHERTAPGTLHHEREARECPNCGGNCEDADDCANCGYRFGAQSYRKGPEAKPTPARHDAPGVVHHVKEKHTDSELDGNVEPADSHATYRHERPSTPDKAKVGKKPNVKRAAGAMGPNYLDRGGDEEFSHEPVAPGEEYDDETGEVECPACGELVSVEEMMCPNCGEDIVDIEAEPIGHHDEGEEVSPEYLDDDLMHEHGAINPPDRYPKPEFEGQLKAKYKSGNRSADDQWVIYQGKKAAMRVKAKDAFIDLYATPKSGEYPREFRSYYEAFRDSAYGQALVDEIKSTATELVKTASIGKKNPLPLAISKVAKAVHGNLIKQGQVNNPGMGSGGNVPEGPAMPGGVSQQPTPQGMTQDSMTTGGMNPDMGTLERYDSDEDHKPLVSDILVDMLAPLVATGGYSSQEIVNELQQVFSDQDQASNFAGSLDERVTSLSDERQDVGQDQGDNPTPTDGNAAPNDTQVQEMAQQLQQKTSQVNKLENKLTKMAQLIEKTIKKSEYEVKLKAAQLVADEMQKRVDREGKTLLPNTYDFVNSGLSEAQAHEKVSEYRAKEMKKMAKMTDEEFDDYKQTVDRFPTKDESEALPFGNMPAMYLAEEKDSGRFGLSDGVFKASKFAEKFYEEKVEKSNGRHW